MKKEIEPYELCERCQQPMQEYIGVRRFLLFWKREVVEVQCENENCPYGRMALAEEGDGEEREVSFHFKIGLGFEVKDG